MSLEPGRNFKSGVRRTSGRMLEAWILEDLDGFSKNELVETVIKWDKEHEARKEGLVKEEL